MKTVNNKKQIVTRIITLFCLLVLVIGMSFAWFGNNGAGDNQIDLSYIVGKVDYSATQNWYDIFYKEFDDDDSDETQEVEGDTYIHANSITLKYGDTEYANDETLNLQQYSKAKFEPKFYDENNIELSTVTDNLKWSSDNKDITVSPTGTVTVEGKVGDTATITLTATDTNKDTQSNLGETVISITINVTSPDTTQIYGSLPPNVNIMRKPFDVENISTVDTKLRLKVDWEYSDTKAGDTNIDTDRTQYTVEDLFKDYPNAKATSCTVFNSPFITTVGKKDSSDLWIAVSKEFADSKLLLVDDTNSTTSIIWCVDTLSLTNEEHSSLVEAIQNANTDNTSSEINYTFNLKMFDKAHAYYYYGDSTTSSQKDYGSIVSPPKENKKVIIPVVEQIRIHPDYVKISTKQIFNIKLTVQARQSKNFFIGKDWFDVVTVSPSGDSE